MAPGPIAVIGGGAWGTALAVHLARSGSSVRLWMLEADLVARMIARRDNPAYLPGVRIPPEVTPCADLGAALERAELVLATVPSQYGRAVYRSMAPHLFPDVPVILATKGIEEGTLALPLEVAAAELGPGRPLAVLSGPSFAREVAEGRPTAVVLAAERVELAEDLQRRLSSRCLRLYSSQDPLGVQLAGALKNVIAIAAGISEGLGMGANASAALITRGLAEIARLGLALGGRAATFSGLAGLGDLVLTCTGELSRNRQLGQRLGRGERLGDILSASRSVAEGVPTARSARALALRARVELPIVEEVYRILVEDSSPPEALDRLLSRPPTSEEASLRDARG